MLLAYAGLVASGIADQLTRRFDRYLEDPREFERRALDECAMYPEGDLLPFVFTIMGCVNHALADPRRSAAAREQADRLLELTIPHVVRRVRPPGGRLEELADYAGHGVYLGEFLLAVGCRNLLGGEPRWRALASHLARLILGALETADGRPLQSYPTILWPFDTVPCLVGLKLADLVEGTDRSMPAIRRHLDWVRRFATDPGTGLPWSELNGGTGRGRTLPRGCDLAYRSLLMLQLDPEYARALYEGFRRRFWIRRRGLAGFAEWPDGQELGEDADSGPVFRGIGLAATGFGAGASLAHRDGPRAARLMIQLQLGKLLLPPLEPVIGGLYPFDDRYLTGGLMGDAILYATLRWPRWGR